jgi:hypothetical protein
MITSLKPNQIFVFGSNMWGRHDGGAAKQAMEFGAEYGINEGLSGQTYAFPTLEREYTKRGIKALQKSRDRLYATCKALPEKTFLLTKVGCGIAGYSEDEIRPLFINQPNNLILPEDWR